MANGSMECRLFPLLCMLGISRFRKYDKNSDGKLNPQEMETLTREGYMTMRLEADQIVTSVRNNAVLLLQAKVNMTPSHHVHRSVCFRHCCLCFGGFVLPESLVDCVARCFCMRVFVRVCVSSRCS